MTAATETYTAPVTMCSERLAQLIAAIGEGALERERTGERPFAAIDLVREQRLGALRIPAEDGGGGASLRELFAVVIALASADVVVAHILRGHFAYVETRLRLGPQERARATELALSGKIVGNAATEIGSTPAGAFTWQTQLTEDGNGFRLNGKKYFTTGTLYSDYTEVLAGNAAGATVGVVVPTDRDGVTILDDSGTGSDSAPPEQVPRSSTTSRWRPRRCWSSRCRMRTPRHPRFITLVRSSSCMSRRWRSA
jgi:alkylation response protein AidB-like acyl-CoA dehydrogenase